jgi:hypothetical protein
MQVILGEVAEYCGGTELANMRLASRSLHEWTSRRYVSMALCTTKLMGYHRMRMMHSLRTIKHWLSYDIHWQDRGPRMGVRKQGVTGRHTTTHFVEYNRYSSALGRPNVGQYTSLHTRGLRGLHIRGNYIPPTAFLLKMGRPNCGAEHLQKITICVITINGELRTRSTILHELLIDSRWLERVCAC